MSSPCPWPSTMAPIRTDGPEGAEEKAPNKQEKAPNLPISLLRNPSTLSHPQPVSVLIQATSEHQDPLKGVASDLGRTSRPSSKVLAPCLGATTLSPTPSWPLSVLV